MIRNTMALVLSLLPAVSIAGDPSTRVYATWDPSDANPALSLSDDRLTVVSTTTSWASVRATIALQSGAWYWETACDYVGAADFGQGMLWRTQRGQWLVGDPGYIGGLQGFGLVLNRAGLVRNDGFVFGDFGEVASGQIVRHWVDFDAKTYQMAVDGSAWQNVSHAAWMNWPRVERLPVASLQAPASGSLTCTANFGATEFVYPVPAGAHPGVFLENEIKRDGFDAS